MRSPCDLGLGQGHFNCRGIGGPVRKAASATLRTLIPDVRLSHATQAHALLGSTICTGLHSCLKHHQFYQSRGHCQENLPWAALLSAHRSLVRCPVLGVERDASFPLTRALFCYTVCAWQERQCPSRSGDSLSDSTASTRISHSAGRKTAGNWEFAFKRQIAATGKRIDRLACELFGLMGHVIRIAEGELR
jgi:hypothetical protein